MRRLVTLLVLSLATLLPVQSEQSLHEAQSRNGELSRNDVLLRQSGQPDPYNGSTCAPRWIHPVSATIAEGFDPPTSPYGSGNRGLEYATDGGEAVSVVDAGTVVFAGNVGRDRFVVVEHPGDLRSTYAFLYTITVGLGRSVSQGETLAIAGPGLHLTARIGPGESGETVYVDPMRFLEGVLESDSGRCRYGARLVPVPSAFEVVEGNAIYATN